MQGMLRKYLSGSVADLRDSNSGSIRRKPASLLFGLPVFVGGLALWMNWGSTLLPSTLLPGASVTTGALMGLVALMFNRVKDAVATPRPLSGYDPAYQAGITFSSVLYAAQTSLLLVGVLLSLSVYEGAVFLRVGWAIVFALFVHLGVKLFFVLRGMKYQVARLLGSRAVPPDRSHLRRIAG